MTATASTSPQAVPPKTLTPVSCAESGHAPLDRMVAAMIDVQCGAKRIHPRMRDFSDGVSDALSRNEWDRPQSG